VLAAMKSGALAGVRRMAGVYGGMDEVAGKIVRHPGSPKGYPGPQETQTAASWAVPALRLAMRGWAGMTKSCWP